MEGGWMMGPDWKRFVDELISEFNCDPLKTWQGIEISRFIKDREIQFLEKALKILDLDEGIPF
jgi:hypothetical protein